MVPNVDSRPVENVLSSTSCYASVPSRETPLPANVAHVSRLVLCIH